MCRIAAYIGPDQPLSTLLYDLPHSLEHMSYAPRELINGTVNVDGTGVAWWREGDIEPLLYRTAQPPWSDPNLPALSNQLSGTTQLAAVRSATPGAGFGAARAHPFVSGTIAGAHNGWIGGFRGPLRRDFIAELKDTRLSELDVMNDSLLLVLLVAQTLDQQGSGLAKALLGATERVSAMVSAADQQATLNLVVASHDRVVGVRTSVNAPRNSLYTLSTDQGHYLASEPMDDRDWTSVPEESLVELTASDIQVSPLN